MGVFNYDKITTNGIDNGAAQISLMAEDVTSTVTSNEVMAHPDTISIFDPTPTISTSCDDAPVMFPTCESDPVKFLCDDDDNDDALLFAGILNDNEDGSSIVAVDELLSLDRILGFDASGLDLDDEWL